MAKLIMKKKNEYFNVDGGVQESTVWTVRDPQDGSLLFVFRERFGKWSATQEAPYGFCAGAQEAPEKAEFYRGMVRTTEPGLHACALAVEISAAENALRSLECFSAMFPRAHISYMRHLWRKVQDDRARIAREDAELERLRMEFDSAPLRDRADLSVLQTGHLRDLSLEYPLFNGELDQSCLVLRQAGEVRAHFWMSRERRRAEFSVSDGWSPEAYQAEEIPQRGLRIPVIRALKFLEERISQILPAPRLPNEIAGRSFTGKGFEFWLARMSQGPFGLDEACMASYGVSALALKTDWEKVWELEEVLDQARKIVRARHRVRNGFYVWKISKESIDQARRDGKFLIGYFSE